MTACKKHSESPVKGYNQCAGCEIEALRAENGRLTREAKNDAIAYKAVIERQEQLREERDSFQREGIRAMEQLEAARGLLREAAEDIESWGAYASAYFQGKHDLAGCAMKYRMAGTGDQEDGGADGSFCLWLGDGMSAYTYSIGSKVWKMLRDGRDSVFISARVIGQDQAAHIAKTIKCGCALRYRDDRFEFSLNTLCIEGYRDMVLCCETWGTAE